MKNISEIYKKIRENIIDNFYAEFESKLWEFGAEVLLSDDKKMAIIRSQNDRTHADIACVIGDDEWITWFANEKTLNAEFVNYIKTYVMYIPYYAMRRDDY